MLRITLAINPYAPSKNTLDFGSYLARLSNSPLTAALLENRKLVELQNNVGGKHVSSADSIIGQTRQWFTEASMKQGVNSRIHHDRGMPFDELIAESRFTDVLIIHPAISFRRNFAGEFTSLAKDILKRAECPVFVVSASVDQIDELILAYDRSASSVFALKMFCYLFPELASRKLTVLRVAPDPEDNDPSQYQLKEWLKMHRSTPAQFVELEGDTDQQLVQFLADKQNSILIMGAYKRGTELLLRRSYAELLIRNTALPLFVTHR